MGGGLIFALLAILYGRIAVKLVHDWCTIPDSSYGLLIPFFAGFVFWEKRLLFRSAPFRPSWAGLPVLLAGLLILFTGIFGADLFLSRLSLLVVAAGLLWTLVGTPTLFRARFLFFVLLLAIPFPVILLHTVTFPLQLFASRLATFLLPFLGVPTLREGNIIQLPALSLEVAEACSGIRSLMSLFTVAIIFGYFVERGVARRTALALASVPIAVAANVARIVGTGLCVQYWDPEKAVGFFHEFAGWFMFVVSLACLYAVHLLITRVIPRGHPASSAIS